MVNIKVKDLWKIWNVEDTHYSDRNGKNIIVEGRSLDMVKKLNPIVIGIGTELNPYSYNGHGDYITIALDFDATEFGNLFKPDGEIW